MKEADFMSDSENKCIKPFISWVDALAETFGTHCEVVLHDLRNLDKSIVKIAHGPQGRCTGYVYGIAALRRR
jgi:predicted transcriptional regulator YheO